MRSRLLQTLLGIGAVALLVSTTAAQTFTYDAAGRLTQVTYPGGTTIAYGYDANGDPVSKSVTPSPPGSGGGGGGGGGCFIATAAYGSELDPHVQTLRDFREGWLRPHAPGRAFIALYESSSPPLAEFLREHELARATTRVLLVPIVYSAAYPRTALAVWTLLAALGIVRLRRRRAAAKLSVAPTR